MARILGQNFRESPTVRFGDRYAEIAAFVSSSEIRVVVPPGDPYTSVDVVLTNFGGQKAVLSPGFRYGLRMEGVFSRGDVNGDRRHNIGDPLLILKHIVEGKPIVCGDAADVNDDGTLDTSDPLSLLLFLFVRGPQPPYPFPFWGTDVTSDALGCGHFDLDNPR